jgi:single-strand DNA-binding protein
VAVGTQSSLLFDFRLPDISQAKPESSTSYDSLLPQIADLPSTSSSINGAPMEKLEAHADRVVFGTVFSPRGVYKAILLGEVGQSPIQKILKSGRAVTIFSVATGGMHNNRRPLEGESPEEYAQRGYAQWHRVAVYQERMGQLAMRHIKQGTQVYLEGNIETRVYNEPVHGAVKHIREIAIRQNGRLLFMDQVSSSSSSYSSSSSPSSAVAPTIDQESSSVAATLPTAISQNSSFAAAATIYDKAFVAENASNGRESASS